MATPKTASRGDSVLWVIACSLAIIAACLVVLVSRQENQVRVETVEAPNIVPTADTSSSAHRLPHSLSPSEPKRRLQAESPAPEPPPSVTEAAPSSEPQSEPASGIKPIVSSGLAPLTALAATNSIAMITGRVRLEGTPPPETVIAFDPQCGRSHPTTNTTKRYLVSSDGGLANVFVFIKSGLEGRQFPTPSQPVMLNQSGCFFEPYVLGLMVNQKLRIKNSDRFLHTVHATPLIEENQAFNVAERPGDMITKTFGSPEIPVKLFCDVHPWMFAYVCVVNNPFFAVTDAKGNYAISNVPPGDYVLEAYHVKTHGNHTGVDQSITVTEGETTTANFTIKLPPVTGRIVERR